MKREEKEMVMALKPDAVKAVQAAKIAMLNHLPFYGTLVSSLPIVTDCDWLPTAATDHRNLYFNPEFVMGMPEERKVLVYARVDAHPFMSQQDKDDYKKYVDVFYRKKTTRELIFVIVHELKHITNDHLFRGKGLDSKGFNIAADHGINTSNVVEFGPKSDQLNWFPQGKTTIFDENKEFGFLAYCYCDFKYLNKTAEEVYALTNGTVQKGKPLGAHIGVYDEDLDLLGYDGEQPGRSAVQEDEDMSWSEDLIKAAAIAFPDDLPTDVRDLVARFGRPDIDYMKIIKNRIVSRIKASKSYRSPSRRSGSQTIALRRVGALKRNECLVLPGRTKAETIDVVIGFDVSGSISRAQLDKIFKEMIALCNMFPYFRVTVFCWSTVVGDVRVYDQTNIHEMLDYKVTTTGGTWAGCAYKYIEENIPNAKDVIMFTDGEIEDLSNKKEWARNYETLWVICGRSRNWKPPFGKVAYLNGR